MYIDRQRSYFLFTQVFVCVRVFILLLLNIPFVVVVVLSLFYHSI